MVMFDHQTGSYWYQVSGEAIVGELTGARLEPLPSVTMPWGEWRELHPDTRMLSRVQIVDGDYTYLRDVFRDYANVINSGEVTFPLSYERVDRALRPADVVLTVRVGGEERVYPLAQLGDGAFEDTVSGEPVVIFSRFAGPYGAAFSREVDGRVLSFAIEGQDFVDAETGSRWNLAGRAITGPFEGEHLRPLPGRRAFWFSIALAIPDAGLYERR